MKKIAFLVIPAIIFTMTACDVENGGKPAVTTAETVVTTEETAAVIGTTIPVTTEKPVETTAVTIPQSAYDNAPYMVIDYEDEPFGTVEAITVPKTVFSSADGYECYSYSMSYPKISIENKTAEKKINDFFVNFEAERRQNSEVSAQKLPLDDNDRMVIEEYKTPIYSSDWTYVIINDSGNIFSVNMIRNFDNIHAVHGSFYSNIFNFDIRTGELIDGGKIVTNIENVGEPFAKGIMNYIYKSGIIYNPEDFLIGDETIEEFFVQWFPERFCVKNGSICVVLDPYELGSFADGIRYIPVPLSEMEPYLTDYAKNLFSNTTSSTAVKMTPYLENGEVKYSAENNN